MKIWYADLNTARSLVENLNHPAPISENIKLFSRIIHSMHNECNTNGLCYFQTSSKRRRYAITSIQSSIRLYIVYANVDVTGFVVIPSEHNGIA